MDYAGKDLIDISKNKMDITSFKKDCMENSRNILFGHTLLTLRVIFIKIR